jgi:hypothetical protein
MRHNNNLAARQIDTIGISGFDVIGEDAPAPALIRWFFGSKPTRTPYIATT